MELSVIIPCLDEEATIAQVVRSARDACASVTDAFEVVVVDNASRDASARLARKAGARIVVEPRRGYGEASRAGASAAVGRYLVFLDGDGTYNPADIPRLYRAAVRSRAAFVIGDRFRGRMRKRAMPFLHRYVGNPFLSFFLRVLFRSRVWDAHCGLRLLHRQAFLDLSLRTSGMEFASEMVVKAAKARLRTRQVPVNYHPRATPSKLRSFHDGWRHLRFMLLLSPTATFFVPGLALLVGGFALMFSLLLGPFTVGGLTFYVHPVLLGSLMAITGFQAVSIGYFSRVFAVQRLGERDAFIDRLQRFLTLERGIVFGSLLFLVALVGGSFIIYHWVRSGFGELDMVRFGVFLSSLAVIGVLLVFNTFFFVSLQQGGDGS